MNKIALIIIGIAMVILSVWGGCYFLHLYPYGEWQNPPIFFTSISTLGAGLYVLVEGFRND